MSIFSFFSRNRNRNPASVVSDLPDTELQRELASLNACDDARKWVGGKSLTEAWNTCERGDWMLWLVGRHVGEDSWPSRQDIVLTACDCAELALKYVPEGEDRPRKAIETARAWTRGEATIEEVRAAAAWREMVSYYQLTDALNKRFGLWE